MDKLTKEFLESKGLLEEYKQFVENKEKSYKNYLYDFSVMIGDADFYLDMSCVFSEADINFLKEWTKGLSDDDDYVFSTGYEDHEKDWTTTMLKNLFYNNPADTYLEGKSFCMGTSYTVKKTNSKPGDYEEYIYERLGESIDSSEFDDKLMKLYKKTGLYKYSSEYDGD